MQSGKFDYYLVSEIRDNYEWTKTFVDYFTSYRKDNGNTICRANGVVSNKFESNYDYFVNIPPFSAYVTQIWEFLIKNQSTVCLTIRGGGGIGKTALVHYICMKYIFESISSSPKFNYVIFCSAKDREFKLNVMTERGQIYSIDSNKIIHSYEDILMNVSSVLDLKLKPDSEENIAKIEENLLNETGVLLIVDDFETLADSEKNKVIELIKRMKIGRHKILITTRSQYLIGADYDIERMNQDQVISFMKKRFENVKNPEVNLQQFKNMLDKHTGEKIYEITMGLPLLAIQLAALLPKKGFSEKLLSRSPNDATEDFLIGRLYEYFSTPTSKLLFIIIAFLVNYDLKTIPINELQIFYKLYCSRYKKFESDFENDLADLKRWNILRTESDYVQVANNISHKIFDQCIKSFLNEFPSSNVFDERIFKIVAKSGMYSGILEYADLENSYIDENIIKIFAFENVLKYINRDRFKLIEIFIQKCLANDDKNTVTENYSEGKKFFDIDSEYNSIFEAHGVVTEKFTFKTPEKVAVSFATISRTLEKILDEVDETLKIRTRELKGERLQNLRSRLGKLCNTDLIEALDNFSAEDLIDAQNVEELLSEISETKTLDCTNNQNYEKLRDKIAEYTDS